MHSYLKHLLIILLAVFQCVAGIRAGYAQYDAVLSLPSNPLLLSQYDPDLRTVQGGSTFDVEPPLIEHEVVAEAEADIRQTFVATVVDDGDLDSVVFFYRYNGESSFARYSMMQVSFSSTYIAQIPTDPNNLNAIEYYIQARDKSGNRTVRGYAFSPLVRQILPAVVEPTAAAESTDSAPVPADSTEVAESGFRKIPKAVYIVGGVLLVGLLASAAGSSGGGSTSGRECGDDGCRLTLTINQP